MSLLISTSFYGWLHIPGCTVPLSTSTASLLHDWGGMRRRQRDAFLRKESPPVALRSVHMASSLLWDSGYIIASVEISSCLFPLWPSQSVYRLHSTSNITVVSFPPQPHCVSENRLQQLTNHGASRWGGEFSSSKIPRIVRKLFPLLKNFKAYDWIRCFPLKDINFVILDHLQSKHSILSPTWHQPKRYHRKYNSLSKNRWVSTTCKYITPSVTLYYFQPRPYLESDLFQKFMTHCVN